MTKTVLTLKRMVKLMEAGGPTLVNPSNAEAWRQLAENMTVLKLLDAAIAVSEAQQEFERVLQTSKMKLEYDNLPGGFDLFSPCAETIQRELKEEQ